MKPPKLLPIAAFLLLAGCNVVATKAPVIETRRANQVALRPGVWSYSMACQPGKPNLLCGKAIPFVRASGNVVRPYISPGLPIADARVLDRASPYVMGSTDPYLLQVRMVDPTGSGPPVQFMFVALAPTTYDSDRRMTAATAWPVFCGPPPKEGDPNFGLQDEQGQVTNHPFPGLHMEDFNCSPDDLAAIRRAAIASRDMLGAANLYSLQWQPG
jgi:hypothetical protein